MSTPNFTITRESDTLLVIEGAGKIDAIAMEALLDRLVADMEGMNHGGLLFRDQGFEWPTFGAIAVELRHWGQMLAMIQKLDRIALLSDQPLIRTAAAIESALIPGITTRNFDPDQEQAARAWLVENP